MSNVLPRETRVRVISALTEGNAVRATSRLTGVDKNTVMQLGHRVGDGCVALHNRLVRDVAAYVTELDEQWSFVGKKNSRVDPSKDPPEYGDVYTFYALDANTKLLISFYVGKRDQESTDIFIEDLRSRLTVIPQITTDGFPCYIEAIGAQFFGTVDYGQVVKQYKGGDQREDRRYEPARKIDFIKKTAIAGIPDEKQMSTSHVERLNLTMRHIVGRKRRLSLAFSKTLRGHRAAEALGVMAYNFTRVHGALGCSPAMKAGLTDHLWPMEELVMAALEEEPGRLPVAQRLKPREGGGVGATRELATGRGFLRAIRGGDEPAPGGPETSPGLASMPPARDAAPGSSSAVALAPAGAVESAPAPPAHGGQLDLFAWRPRPMPKGQLSLFRDQ